MTIRLPRKKAPGILASRPANRVTRLSARATGILREFSKPEPDVTWAYANMNPHVRKEPSKASLVACHCIRCNVARLQ